MNIKFKRNKKIEIDRDFEDLNPKDNVEIKSEKILDEIINRNDVNNIAITGNYSSGKSTAIRSYLKRNEIENITFISLAKLSNSTMDENAIEKSIIEQLFYNNVNEVNKLNNVESGLIASIISFIILLIFNMTIGINVISNFLLNWGIEFGLKILKYLFFVIMILIWSLFYYISKRIQNITKIGITSFNFSLNIDVNNKADNGIINNNLHLIEEFVKQAKIKYIVFEDLDRFDKPIIFEHLRNLNFILNKCGKVKFIYLIKDDIFESENRTKFFDAIYPVVPFISYGQAGEELYKLVEKYGLKDELPKDFILDIGLFVQEPRILQNTLNEYRIYAADLNRGDEVRGKELFSLMLYKNIFPADFANLQNDEGVLYETIKKLYNRKTEEKEKLWAKINDLKTQLININDNMELYYYGIYLDIVEKVKDFSYTIYIENPKRNYEKSLNNINSFIHLLKTIDIDLLLDEDTTIHSWNLERQSIVNLIKDSSNLLIYKKYKKQATDKLEKEIYDTEGEIAEIEKKSISDMFALGYFTENDLEGFECSSKEKELLMYFLSNGLIHENYNVYIAKFHEGSICKEDQGYLTALMSHKKVKYDYKLKKPSSVIEKLHGNFWNLDSILNIDLMLELINKGNSKVNEIFRKLEKCDDISGFFETLQNRLKELPEIQKKFFKEFSKYNNFWNILKNIDDKTLKVKILEETLAEISLLSLNNINERMGLKEFIEENNVLLDDNYNKNLDEVRKLLSVKYTKIDFKNIDEKIINSCIENDNYKINPNNMNCIYKTLQKNKDVSEASSLFSELCKNTYVEKYIKENINEFVDNVFFKEMEWKTNKYNDMEKDFIYLLNNESIDIDKRKRIISLEYAKITDLTLITDDDIKIELVKNNKIILKIENINEYCRIANSSKEVADYMNLNKEELLIEFNGKDLSFLYENLSLENNLDNELYNLITQNQIETMDILKIIETLEKEKIEILINNKTLIPNNYSELIKIDESLFVLFIEKYSPSILYEEIIEFLDLIDNNIIKLKLINLYIDIFDKDSIKDAVNRCLKDYSAIFKNRAKPRYDYNKELEDLLISLKEKFKYNINYGTYLIFEDKKKIALTNTIR